MRAGLFFLPIHLLVVVLAKPARSDLPTSQQLDSMKKILSFNKAYQEITATDNATENGLSGACRPVMAIFAKGTEDNGNVGNGNSPGPAWFSEMRKSIGEENITVQGIDYDANLLGYFAGGDQHGSQRYLDVTNEIAKKCPDAKIVLGGYSQGAQLAHNAADQFSRSVTSRIVAAVLFGDPYGDSALGKIPSRAVLKICHARDVICRGFGAAPDHINYAQDAAEAANFVVQRLDKQK